MKPYRLMLPLLLATPALVPVVGAVASNPAFRTLEPEALQVLDEVVVDPAPSLARPSADTLIAQEIEIPRRPSSPPPPTTTVSTVVRLGDTLLKIAQRYGLTMGELLQLNPGLETARLVVGSQVQVVRSAPGRSRMLLGLAPVGSGGLSWPELPSFGNDQRPTSPYLRGSSALIWPAQGTFTSGYGWRWGRMHRGIDIANNVGTPIVAAARGRVSFAGWHEGGYGYFVEITHEDGSRTRYGHNSNLLVREGQQVDQGQVISKMGSSGRSTGPHLHFEVLPAGEGAMNPLQFLPPRA
ncbi:MAG: M23 family metallopeptidase [Cyanobacteria bacterium]|nr:M23 family metallopeptidase [Cyanobacteriota bacterium]